MNSKQPPAEKVPAAPQVQGEGDYESARKFSQDTERFLRNADVDDLAQRAAPKTKEEAAELQRAEARGKSHRASAGEAQSTPKSG